MVQGISILIRETAVLLGAEAGDVYDEESRPRIG
jgi:hypothetical protein